MKIYFETKELKPLSQFMNMPIPRVISSNNGYRNMICDAATCIKNGWDIYTNDISLLGASELFGDRFLHKIMIRNSNNSWVELNHHVLRKLSKPINIEQYFRRYICN